MKYPDVATVRRKARADWERQFKRSLSIEERIGRSTPWWIVIVALVFFALSVPHTMVVFDKITPDVGKVAPFGIEFGLLFASFRRRVGKMTIQLWILEVLLFVTAIIVNGAGSLEAVVKATENVQGQSIAMLVQQLPNLPATSQVALILVPVAALIIPIGTVAAGEGLAALVLERQDGIDLITVRWVEVASEVEFEALRDAAISMGNTPARSIKWAGDIVQMSVATSRTVTDSITDEKRPEIGQRSGHQAGRGHTRTMDARDRVRAHLQENPEAVKLSVRDLGKRAGVSKTIAHEELSAFQAVAFSGNGHGRAEYGEGE